VATVGWGRASKKEKTARRMQHHLCKQVSWHI
jgi:hypothetical protein